MFSGTETTALKEKEGLTSLMAQPKVIRAIDETLNTTKEIKNAALSNTRSPVFRAELKILKLTSYSVETTDKTASVILSIAELISKPLFILNLPALALIITLLLKGGK